jgi:hypothetical protein
MAPNTAVSSLAKFDFAGEELTIYTPDENNETWGPNDGMPANGASEE